MSERERAFRSLSHSSLALFLFLFFGLVCLCGAGKVSGGGGGGGEEEGRERKRGKRAFERKSYKKRGSFLFSFLGSKKREDRCAFVFPPVLFISDTARRHGGEIP